MRIVESERETRRVVGDEVVVVVDVAGTDFSRVLGLGRGEGESSWAGGGRVERGRRLDEEGGGKGERSVAGAGGSGERRRRRLEHVALILR